MPTALQVLHVFNADYRKEIEKEDEEDRDESQNS
jgi:hypothetical protein